MSSGIVKAISKICGCQFNVTKFPSWKTQIDPIDYRNSNCAIACKAENLSDM